MLALIDGRLSARRVIDLAQLGTFDGTRCLAELRQAGVIRPLDSDGVRPLHRQPVESPSLRRFRAAAALLPIAVLAGVTWWTATRAAASPVAGQRIERHALASLRQAFAARALHNAIEAYRLARGVWPERLEDLERAGLVAPGALATLEGRPYYFVHREQGLVVLAPERS